MFTGKKVQIRWRTLFPNQRVRVFLGEILEMNDHWIKIKGKSYYFPFGGVQPIIDKDIRVIGVPRGAISSIRIFPDGLDFSHVKYKIVANQLIVEVPKELGFPK